MIDSEVSGKTDAAQHCEGTRGPYGRPEGRTWPQNSFELYKENHHTIACSLIHIKALHPEDQAKVLPQP